MEPTYLGYQLISDLSASVGFTLPAGTQEAIRAVIRVEASAIRLFFDGSNPTAALGWPLADGGIMELSQPQFVLANIRMINQTAGAKVHVLYFA